MNAVQEELIKRAKDKALLAAKAIILWLDTAHGVPNYIKSEILNYKAAINEVRRLENGEVK